MKNKLKLPDGVTITATISPSTEEILAPEAVELIVALHRNFNQRRKELLQRRALRQADLDAGKTPDFLAETQNVRTSDWTVAPIPADLQDRRVEITGPTDGEGCINALNSGAKVFMADFEDANTPAWENLMEGQCNLRDAIRRTIEFKSPEGKDYRLKEQVAVLSSTAWLASTGKALLSRWGASVRQPVDFALYMFHNAKELLARRSGPYIYYQTRRKQMSTTATETMTGVAPPATQNRWTRPEARWKDVIRPYSQGGS